jgi:hypothetical protein
LVSEGVELPLRETSIFSDPARGRLLLLYLTVNLPPLVVGKLLKCDEPLLASGADHSTFASSLLDCGASIAPPSCGRYLWEKVIDEVVWHC